MIPISCIYVVCVVIDTMRIQEMRYINVYCVIYIFLKVVVQEQEEV